MKTSRRVRASRHESGTVSDGVRTRLLRPAAGAALLAASLSISGCSGFSDGPNGDSRGYSLSEEGRAEAEQARIEAEIDGYRELFKDENLPAPVELIAGPLTITPLAEARGELMSEIRYLDPGIHSRYLDNLAEAQAALVEAASDPRLAEEVGLYFDAEISDATREASGIYIYSEADGEQIDNMMQIIDAKHELAEMISDEELKRLTLELLHADLTIMLGRSKGDVDASLIEAIISKLPQLWQERARGVIDEESDEKLNQLIEEYTANLDKQQDIVHRAIIPYLYGDAYSARQLNAMVYISDEYREAHPQPGLPAVKSILLDAISAIDNPETAQAAMNMIAAVPSEYDIARTEAKEAALKQIMNNLARSIESIGPSDTAEEIKSLIAVFNGYLNAMPDQELQQQLRNVTEIWVADAYVQLPITNAEHSAVRQQLLGFITDESLLTLIQKAFGGDEQSIGELERLKENADDQASIYYSIWVDGEDGVGTYVHVTYGPLRIGSDDDMIEINRLATEYIATNP